jgi:immune inhibitor A
MKAKLFNASLIVVMLLVALVPVVGAAPEPAVINTDPQFGSDVDDAPHPLGDRQREARAAAFEAQAHGSAHGHKHEVKHGEYVELDRLGEDSIWTVLGQFGTQIHPSYGGTTGPLRNEIPEPNRKFDNATIWVPDFNRDYFTDLLFSEAPNAISMRNYYIEQSSNRYTVNGIVEDWVDVPYNEARYGANYCGSIVCSTTWLFVRDSVSAWYNKQIANGMTPAQIDAYLSQFDVWDRYDYDGDGNFTEPDGYIDHFQSVHAGEGEETGGGAQGSDAIWSHRWYAFYNNIGVTGPAFNLFGGVQVGGSSYWIGDYTVEPENGGVGVFAHEFGHDLGLPDLYDTSGNTGGAENSTGFWTLYSSGSYGNSGKPKDGIGTKPVHMSAYEKLYLGWSNYRVVNFGQKANVKLGPAEFNTIDAQQLLVLLPDKQVDFTLWDPFAGSYFYYSGAGNNLDNNMTREITLPGAGPITLSMQAKYHIEACWDYAYVEVSTDGGTTFASIPTSASTLDNTYGQNFGNGITGTSGSALTCDVFADPVWVPVTADLSGFAGQTIQLRFRYWSDGAVVGDGFSVDDIMIDGLPADGAETDPGWVYSGFDRTTGTSTQSFFNMYIAEFRQYVGYDKSLKTGPYNFGFLDNPDRQNWVEHFPYQDGLLVWYYDESFADNNVGDHCLDGRCGGLFLPVDAHPDLLMRPDGLVWRPRIQAYDSTFGLDRTDGICLHLNSVKKCYRSQRANPLFDDTRSYWVAPDPSVGNFGWASVPLPGFGVTIRVMSVKKGEDDRDDRHHDFDGLGGGWMKVRVDFK